MYKQIRVAPTCDQHWPLGIDQFLFVYLSMRQERCSLILTSKQFDRAQCRCNSLFFDICQRRRERHSWSKVIERYVSIRVCVCIYTDDNNFCLFQIYRQRCFSYLFNNSNRSSWPISIPRQNLTMLVLAFLLLGMLFSSRSLFIVDFCLVSPLSVVFSSTDHWHSKSKCTQKEFANHMDISCSANEFILIGWSHYGTKKTAGRNQSALKQQR